MNYLKIYLPCCTLQDAGDIRLWNSNHTFLIKIRNQYCELWQMFVCLLFVTSGGICCRQIETRFKFPTIDRFCAPKKKQQKKNNFFFRIFKSNLFVFYCLFYQLYWSVELCCVGLTITFDLNTYNLVVSCELVLPIKLCRSK